MRAAAVRLVAFSIFAWILPALAGSVQLRGPEVYKLDWNTRALDAADVDGDGRTDLLLLNNDASKVELLLQRPPRKAERAAKRRGSTRRWEPRLEDARFDRTSLVTGIGTYDLAAGDLDGDGRIDLVYTGDPDGLTVRYQDGDGDWERRRVFRDVEPAQWSSNLEIVDLDGDGRNELVVLAQREVRVYARDENGRLGEPRRYPLADEGCYGLLVRHVDEDERLDLLYLVPRSDYAWRVRFQRAGGEFGPERSFRVPTPRRRLVPIRVDERDAFASVNSRTGLIEFQALARHEEGPGPEDVMSIRVYSTPTDDNGSQHYATGDLDGDGDLDLVVGDRRGARVWLWTQDSGGVFATQVAFPSLSDIRSVVAGDVDGDGRHELFVASPGEGTIGLSRMLADGRLSYPEPVVTGERPLDAAAVDLDGDGRVELCWLDRDDSKRSVVVHRLQDDGSWAEGQRVELADLRTDPLAIEGVDADADSRADLVVFTLQNPLRLLQQQSDGSFVEVSAAGSFRSGLVDDLLPAGLGSGDVDADGRDELIVAGQGYARALRLTGKGVLEVIDQFNAERSDAVVSATFVVDVDGDGTNEVLLVIEETSEIAVLERDRRGVYRQRTTIPIGPIEVVDAGLADLEHDGTPDLLLFGKDRFWSVPAGRVDFEVRTLGSYEADLEELSYHDLAAGDLDGDGQDELVALDSRLSHILQVLSRDADGSWESALHFTVFETDPHYQGRPGARSEPRELLLADATSDGATDVVLLVHDRLLVYSGVPAPPEEPEEERQVEPEERPEQ
jgi:hypothetical protein